MSKLGAFDAYVQDEQEKAMQVKYEQYLKENDPKNGYKVMEVMFLALQPIGCL